jgi:hypothetical protein
MLGQFFEPEESDTDVMDGPVEIIEVPPPPRGVTDEHIREVFELFGW